MVALQWNYSTRHRQRQTIHTVLRSRIRVNTQKLLEMPCCATCSIRHSTGVGQANLGDLLQGDAEDLTARLAVGAYEAAYSTRESDNQQ